MNAHQPFESVVDQYGPTVLRVCRMVLGFHADADDAWSETFLAALRAWPTLESGVNLEAWLVTIAHRKAIDVTRRRARQALPLAEVPETPQTGPVDEWDGSEAQQAVRRLPAKQRQAIAYHYLAGLPYAEVAAVIGGTEVAARRAAADGMRSLRRYYGLAAKEG